MISPAQRHRAKVLAATAAIATAGNVALARPTSGAEATEYELQRARLGEDLRRLKEIQSIEAKIELKRVLIPDYDPWIEGVLAAEQESGRGVQDDILVQAMIWTIDTGDYVRALPLITYVLRHGLTLPERFNRTAATLIVEEIAEAALKHLAQDENADYDLLAMIEILTMGHDMPDEVRAKLEKAMGLQLARIADRPPEEAADGPAGSRPAAIAGALTKLRRAYALNDKAGVKKQIERLEREQAKLPAPEGGATE